MISSFRNQKTFPKCEVEVNLVANRLCKRKFREKTLAQIASEAWPRFTILDIPPDTQEKGGASWLEL
jgi:hypothetical protein